MVTPQTLETVPKKTIWGLSSPHLPQPLLGGRQKKPILAHLPRDLSGFCCCFCFVWDSAALLLGSELTRIVFFGDSAARLGGRPSNPRGCPKQNINPRYSQVLNVSQLNPKSIKLIQKHWLTLSPSKSYCRKHNLPRRTFLFLPGQD